MSAKNAADNNADQTTFAQELQAALDTIDRLSKKAVGDLTDRDKENLDLAEQIIEHDRFLKEERIKKLTDPDYEMSEWVRDQDNRKFKRDYRRADRDFVKDRLVRGYVKARSRRKKLRGYED
jgi:phosphoenolpyruvate-protein kinase (PTS system EI component)